ncbi:hypothetical protein LDENG_00274440 [Lucifuga dentata]|nr:hypothetical protein LDENG_00274440 [Lucifuga dentata]
MSPEMVEQLGLGCHQLIIYASNKVTFSDVSTNLQVCVLEEVAGLQASVVAEDDCGHSPVLNVSVSLQRGAPVQLLFFLTGDNSSISESREMLQNKRKEIHHIRNPIKGSLQVKLRAWNVFSALDVDLFPPHGKDSVLRLNNRTDHSLISNKKNDELVEEHIRVVRAPKTVTVKPSATIDVKEMISLEAEGYEEDKNRRYEWQCGKDCKCQGTFATLIHKIEIACLPNPFQYFKYNFVEIKKSDNNEKTKESECITLTAKKSSIASLSCLEGCNPITRNKDAQIKMNCPSNDCTAVVWNIKDPRSENSWNYLDDDTKSCYTEAGKQPLTIRQDGGTQYAVKYAHIAQAKSEGLELIVVMTYESGATGANVPVYTTYTVTSSSTQTTASPSQTTATTSNSKGTTTTTTSNSKGTTTTTTSSSKGTTTTTTSSSSNSKGKHLRCSKESEVKSLFLPVGESDSSYTLIITATAKNSKSESTTSITTQVRKSKTDSRVSLDDLQSAVENAVRQLKEQGLMSGATLGQIFSSVSSNLNSQSDESGNDAQQKLREQMLDIMIGSVKNSPIKNPQEVQVTSRGLAGIVKKGSELSASAQEKASLLLENLSSSLISMDLKKTKENKEQTQASANTIAEAASNMLDYSSTEKVSSVLLNALNNIQSALLKFLEVNEGPAVLQQTNVGVLVERKTSGSLHKKPINIPDNKSTRFSLPVLPLNIISSEETVDVRMLSFKKNPFSWHKSGNISSEVSSLSLTKGSGSSVPVENLKCKYWDEAERSWSSYGCRVGVQTTPLVTQCLCNHLTMFGTSFFVTPNLVDPSRSAELFGTFTENPVVVCFVGALFVGYLLAVIWARHKDIQDTAKVTVTVLEDNDPLDEYGYLLCIRTGHRRRAATSSQVIITLLGAEGNSEPHHLTDPKKCVFERGGVDMFLITTPYSLGDLQGIRLWHNNSGANPAWYVSNVVVQDLKTEQQWHFLCNSWLAIDVGDCSLDKVFSVSTDMDLKRFRNLFFMKTTKDFNDGHLWFSVINRPASSSFTRVQRVSCCFSLLLCTMLTSIMFYGIPTDPSEQTLDLGHFEFTWQQFMIGVQSSLIMFPVNLLIVSIFRIARPREMPCCKAKAHKLDVTQTNSTSWMSSLQTATTDVNVSEITLDTVIKDIARIVYSLSTSSKSNIESEFELGQQGDINAVLSVMEDLIRRNNKFDDATNAPSKTQSSHIYPQLPEDSDGVQSNTAMEDIQKKNNRAQFLYRKLCHIDMKLSLLGASSFPTAHSYSQAMQQVQSMKVLLEGQILTSSCGNQDELAQTKFKRHTYIN